MSKFCSLRLFFFLTTGVFTFSKVINAFKRQSLWTDPLKPDLQIQMLRSNFKQLSYNNIFLVSSCVSFVVSNKLQFLQTRSSIFFGIKASFFCFKSGPLGRVLLILLIWGVKCEKFNFRKLQGICKISFENCS